MPAQISLSPTSALVLLWDGDSSYTSRLSRRYLRCLDLKAGKKLFAECAKIWPHYAENIKNRKHCIFQLATKFLTDIPKIQIVILGAGIAPLSLEIHSSFPSAKVFDVDRSFMEAKKRIARRILPRQSRVRFVSADVSNVHELSEKLVAAGWDFKKPSIIIVEGLSYYISRKALRNIFSFFKTKNQKNRIIIEYLLLPKQIAKERRSIALNVFKEIARQCVSFKPAAYSFDDLSCMIKKSRGPAKMRFRMKDMKKLRTGRNRYFPSARSGWVETAFFPV